MRKNLSAIIVVLLMLTLGVLTFGCDSVTPAQQQDNASEEQGNASEDSEFEDEDFEEEEAEVEESYTPGDGPRVVMETTKGRIVVELFPDVAPKTVKSFQELIGKKFYDGLTFHRYEPGFVIQGGDPKGDGTGGPGYTVPAEFSDRKHVRGTLAMARSNDPNSAGSQFYIVLERAPHLDRQYTIFGHVIEGMENVLNLRAGDVMTKVVVQEAAGE